MPRLLAIFSLVASLACNAVTASVRIPDPAIDSPLATAKGEQTAVIAGGCFWGIEAVFDHVKGVTGASSGYSGGAAKTAHYDKVSAGDTGHAESVQITYDPAQISYGQLLKIFFSIAHDPTQLNRQGNDVGTQYRSEIFYHNATQKEKAEYYINKLNQVKAYKNKIVTQIAPYTAFYEAKDYHQDYYDKNPDQAYCHFVIQPEVERFRKVFKNKLKNP